MSTATLEQFNNYSVRCIEALLAYYQFYSGCERFLRSLGESNLGMPPGNPVEDRGGMVIAGAFKDWIATWDRPSESDFGFTVIDAVTCEALLSEARNWRGLEPVKVGHSVETSWHTLAMSICCHFGFLLKSMKSLNTGSEASVRTALESLNMIPWREVPTNVIPQMRHEAGLVRLYLKDDQQKSGTLSKELISALVCLSQDNGHQVQTGATNNINRGRGRPQKPAEPDARLARDWETSGLTKKEFAEARGIKYDDLIDALERHRKRLGKRRKK